MRTCFTHSRATLSQTDTDGGANLHTERLSKLHVDLSNALGLFTVAHGKALKSLYRRYPASTGTTGDNEAETGVRPVIDSSKPNESIFTLYFFLFNLEEFAKELLHLINLMIDVREEEEDLDRRRAALDQKYGRLLGYLIWAFDIGNVGRFPSAGKKTQRFKTLRERLCEMLSTSSFCNSQEFSNSNSTKQEQIAVSKCLCFCRNISSTTLHAIESTAALSATNLEIHLILENRYCQICNQK